MLRQQREKRQRFRPTQSRRLATTSLISCPSSSWRSSARFGDPREIACRFDWLVADDAVFIQVANVYFLLIGCLQQIPGLSPTGQYTTIGPLVVFVTLAMAREAYDDLKRHRRDRVENNVLALVWRDHGWRPTRWRDIVVGDIVCVRDGESFPADIVLLHSSHTNGVCYVETSSLDGEVKFTVFVFWEEGKVML